MKYLLRSVLFSGALSICVLSGIVSPVFSQDTAHIQKTIQGGVTGGLSIPSGLSLFIYHQFLGDLYGEAGVGFIGPWYSYNAGLKFYVNSDHLIGIRYSSLIVWLSENPKTWPTLSVWFGSSGREESSSALFWGLGILFPLTSGLNSSGILPFAEIGFRLFSF
ncbi:MAG: hypothetical protein ACHQM6_03840 [Candidatus Kapaibacterium sp.]